MLKMVKKNQFRTKKVQLNPESQTTVEAVFKDPNGIAYGINPFTGKHEVLDNFDFKTRDNGNTMLLGSPGSGKTYAMACLSLRFHAAGVQTFLISSEPRSRFGVVTEKVGGKHIHIWPGSADNINIMEIRKHGNTVSCAADGVEEPLLARKMQSVHVFMEILLPDITAEESELLDKVLLSCYGKFGITMDNDSLYASCEGQAFKQMPIIGDLYDELLMEGNKANRMSDALVPFISGDATSFNQPTNVDIDAPFVFLDIDAPYLISDPSGHNHKITQMCLFLAIDLAWDKVQADSHKKNVVMVDDILWLVDQAPVMKAMSDYILAMFKQISKYNGCIVAAEEDVSYLVNNAALKSILNACEIHGYFYLNKSKVEQVWRVLDLTEDEAQRLGWSFSRGDMILTDTHNSIKTYAHIKASPEELAICCLHAEA